jgi:hypothetical protein
MPPHCRVTFFDRVHQIHRCLEVKAGLPLVAAESALQWLKNNHVPVEDLDKTVKVEVITTVQCALSIEPVNGHLQIAAAPETKGAAA